MGSDQVKEISQKNNKINKDKLQRQTEKLNDIKPKVMKIKKGRKRQMSNLKTSSHKSN